MKHNVIKLHIAACIAFALRLKMNASRRRAVVKLQVRHNFGGSRQFSVCVFVCVPGFLTDEQQNAAQMKDDVWCVFSV